MTDFPHSNNNDQNFGLKNPKEKVSNGNNDPCSGLATGGPICPDGVNPISEIGVSKVTGPKKGPTLTPKTTRGTSTRSQSPRGSTTSGTSTSSDNKVDPLQRGPSRHPNQQCLNEQQAHADAMDSMFD